MISTRPQGRRTSARRRRVPRAAGVGTGQRRGAKKALSSSAHSAASRPPATSGRWFRRGSPSTSSTLPQAPAFGSRGAVDDARHAREHDRAGAHRARLERHVEDASSTRQLPSARGGLAQREDLGVRRRVLAQLALVVAGREDLAVAHDDRADRHVVVFQRALGLAQREAHEVLVAWEEAFAHRSRPRCLRQCLAAARPRHVHHYRYRPCPLLPPHRRRSLEALATSDRARVAAAWRAARARWPSDRRGPRSRAGAYAPDRVVVRLRAVRDRRRTRRRPSPQPRRSSGPSGAALASLRLAPRRERRVGAAPAAPRPGRGVGGARLLAARAPARSSPTTPAAGHVPGGWQHLQWNFAGRFGVERAGSLGERRGRRARPAGAG